jgi:trigger factor
VLSGCTASKGLQTDELSISNYKQVEVDEVTKPDEVTDEDVESQIATVLQNYPQEDTDHVVETGDKVYIDYVGKMDGEEFDGGSASGYMLEIGSGTFIDGFEDSIIGHNVGETFDWDGAFPENYSAEDYAGKDVTFTITIDSVVPDEITDDLVQQISETSETVEEYKEEVKSSLEDQAQASFDSTLQSEAWQAVLDNTEVTTYDEDEPQETLESTLEQYEAFASYYGMEYEDMIEQQMGIEVEEFEQQVEDQIRENIKGTMAAEAIADKENLDLSDDEYEAKYEEIAENNGYEDVDSLKSSVGEDTLKDYVLLNVVKEWVAKRCIQIASN